MWQCDNCGYTDEDGKTFEEEVDEENPEETVRYCPECGSDEVYLVDEDDEEDEDEDDADDDGEDADDEDDDEDWDDEDDDDEFEDDDLDEDESW